MHTDDDGSSRGATVKSFVGESCIKLPAVSQFFKTDGTGQLKHIVTLKAKFRAMSGDYEHVDQAGGSRRDEPRSNRKSTVPRT